MPLPAQQRLWFLDRLDPGKLTYSIPTGALDRQLGSTDRSVSEVVRRHEALRTHFTQVDGQPIQAFVRLLLSPTRDRPELPPTEREQKARRLAIEEAERPLT